MKRFFILIILILPAYVSFSQFNDSTYYYVKYALTGIINKTDELQSYVLNNALSFNVNKKTYSINFGNSWVYGKQGGLPTNNDFSSALNFDLYKNQQRIYYWGLTTFTSSYSLKINYQFQAGTGIGWNIVNKKNTELVISDGILYETSDLEDPALGRLTYNTFRNSLRLKHRLVLKDMISLEGAHFWQPSFADISDYSIRSNTTLSVKLMKWLNLTAGVAYNRYSRTQRENLLINFGLTVERYF